MSLSYRSLTKVEIAGLVEQGCRCDDWSKVEVVDGFEASSVRGTFFSGAIKLGRFDKEVEFCGGFIKRTGISNASMHNCVVGNNVYINQIKSYIANYVIEDDVVIENIDLISVDGESCFGNGVEAVVLNEGGGREIMIYDKLSAQIGYIMALYRHRPVVIKKLQEMIGVYCASARSSMGLIGRGSRLINCRTLKNMKVGPFSRIEGCDRLENGSLNSSEDDPIYIGPRVIAENFIACSGSEISDGAIVCDCFVGQGCVLSKQYSAENSVFFANCAGFHGEACSIFAGPYTVTHHKSTLLIAGLYSFLNAGSGSNQSNHMYKLGPVHQGVVERGSKTTSDSYLLWPAKIGAFTLVMGRHYRNCDTSDLPFSYLIEHEDESILVPGVNLRSVGTVRDARKWPKRDKRNDPIKLDIINFKLLSPFTVQKMLAGHKLLKELKRSSGENCDYFAYHNVKIRNSSLEHGIDLYETGITKFLGNCLIKRLEGKNFETEEDLRNALRPVGSAGKGRWLDLAGLFAPGEVVNDLLDDIESGDVAGLEELASRFAQMHENYANFEWAWAEGVLQEHLGKSVDQITSEDITGLVEKWKSCVVRLDKMLYEDASKEFSSRAQVGFGIDGDKAIKEKDFAAVRGGFGENSFVTEIEKHIEAKTSLGDELIGRIKKIGR